MEEGALHLDLSPESVSDTLGRMHIEALSGVPKSGLGHTTGTMNLDIASFTREAGIGKVLDNPNPSPNRNLNPSARFGARWRGSGRGRRSEKSRRKVAASLRTLEVPDP